MFRLRNRKGNFRNHFKHKSVMKILHISDTHSHHQPAERRPRHPPRLPAADRGTPQGPHEAGSQIRRRFQGCRPQHPPRRGRLRQEGPEEG